MRMDAVTALAQLGGIASRTEVITLSSTKKLRVAVKNRRIQRIARNRYKLPDTETGSAAARVNGYRSHLSAAQFWNWEVKVHPRQPQVTVPRGRKVATARYVGVSLYKRMLRPEDVDGQATSKLRTVVDCARDLPFDEALAVADSALRSGDLTTAELAAGAASTRGPRAERVRRVAAYADGRAANPFESVLRAIAIDAGLDVVPQTQVEAGGAVMHPDLVDSSRRMILEADSWQHHASQEDHDRDCQRYNAFVAAGWAVLRFTWHHVMGNPAYVRETLLAVAAGRSEFVDGQPVVDLGRPVGVQSDLGMPSVSSSRM